jgi:hypothetical protein
MLATSDVTVKTGAGAVSIGVLSPLTWASTHRLTLDSVQFVQIKAAVVAEGTAGLTLTTNDGGSGGDLLFENGGAVTFWDTASSLVINGASYALVETIKTLASDIKAHPSHNYALSADYDAGQDGTHGITPVATVFSGTFEGLGHAISNFSIQTGRNIPQTALFADLGPRGTLRDIALVNANVTANMGIAAPLVAQNDGAIINASATGSVSTSGPRAGGLAAVSTGTIVMSYSTAAVGCSSCSAGGLVGAMQGGLIMSSHATGAVSCGGGAGGLVGGVSAGKIRDSYATGRVSTYGRNGNYTVISGGLVGSNAGTIAFSFATGDASAYGSEGEEDGEGYAGGLVAGNRGTIHDSYATGTVGAGPHTVAGGLVEENDGSISNSYSTGAVYADQRGGLLGQDYSTTAHSYWDFDTSGISNPDQGAGDPLNDPGITGLTDAQLKSALPAGFDPNVWGQNASINNGWPYLLANPPQ